MESKTAEKSNMTFESLLDPSNPYVLTVVLPVAVLGALGFRKAAVFWVLAVVAWQTAKQLL